MRILNGVLFTSFLVLLASCTKVEQKPLLVDQLFTNHMVLQANKPISIWGTATPERRIEIDFRNQHVAALVNEEGQWSTTLDNETYGGPDSLVIHTADQRIVLNDVLVGEVWICAGQSNMEMPLLGNWAHTNNAVQEVASANYPNIRLFSVQKSLSFSAIDTIITQGWQLCDTASIKEFSATAYFFGRKLFQELNIPIGLIHTSWGGTVAEAWTSNASLANLPDFAERAAKINALNLSADSLQKKFEADTRIMNSEIAVQDPGIKDGDTIFAAFDLDDSDWMPIDLPKMWEETELGTYDGSTWFRKTIQLSEKLAQKNYTIVYGAPDDWDEVWVNGVKVGENKAWDVIREYKIPDGLLKVGKNVITIRIYDMTGGGGFMGEAKDYYLLPENGQKIPIAKGWVAKKGFDFVDIKTQPVSATDPNQPTVLYNAMINPLIPYTIQGAIWYQGESNSGRAHQYRELFKTMITDWRTNWGQGEFPFFFVQLANYLPRNSEPTEDAWAELREAQAMALELPNTGMAVTIEIGNPLDIHPGNKQDVGLRLALNALAKVYNRDIPFASPMFDEVTFEENIAVVSFKNTYDGLKVSNGKALKGFSMAGADKVFYWAEAVIINENTVEVSCDNVEQAASIRYGWSSNPEVNLVNSANLPASPFRTDDWKGITQ